MGLNDYIRPNFLLPMIVFFIVFLYTFFRWDFSWRSSFIFGILGLIFEIILYRGFVDKDS